MSPDWSRAPGHQRGQCGADLVDRPREYPDLVSHSWRAHQPGGESPAERSRRLTLILPGHQTCHLRSSFRIGLLFFSVPTCPKASTLNTSCALALAPIPLLIPPLPLGRTRARGSADPRRVKPPRGEMETETPRCPRQPPGPGRERQGRSPGRTKSPRAVWAEGKPATVPAAPPSCSSPDSVDLSGR